MGFEAGRAECPSGGEKSSQASKNKEVQVPRGHPKKQEGYSVRKVPTTRSKNDNLRARWREHNHRSPEGRLLLETQDGKRMAGSKAIGRLQSSTEAETQSWTSVLKLKG